MEVSSNVNIYGLVLSFLGTDDYDVASITLLLSWFLVVNDETGLFVAIIVFYDFNFAS